MICAGYPRVSDMLNSMCEGLVTDSRCTEQSVRTESCDRQSRGERKEIQSLTNTNTRDIISCSHVMYV